MQNFYNRLLKEFHNEKSLQMSKDIDIDIGSIESSKK